MAARCSELVAIVMAVVLAGCAARREARVRRNWDKADPAAPGSVGENGTNPDEQDPSSPGAVPPKQGWDRVEELLTRTTDVLVTAPSPEVLAELATKWCEVEPIPRQTEHGEVRVCYLYPPVRVKGVALTLELSANGIVGFVAPELDAIKSQEIAMEARRTLAPLCERPWVDASTELDLQTCTVDGGSTLAVGRLQPRPDTDRWQVSVAVLGAI